MEIIAWSVNLKDKKYLVDIRNSNVDRFCTDYP